MPLPPIVSSCLLSLAIGCASNIIAQWLNAHFGSKPFVFDQALFIRFALLSVLTTPVNYYWQSWLERTFPGWKHVKRSDVSSTSDIESGIPLKDEGEDKRVMEKEVRVRNWWNILCKWFCDCITFGALLNTTMFLVLMGVMEGKAWAQIEDMLRRDMWTIIWDSYRIWPIANLISTMYVPVEKRVVFLSFFGLLWNIYLTLFAARM
jgi:hypothetical protein